MAIIVKGKKSIVRTVSRLLRWPPVGKVNLGDLRRITPISRNFGFDRGTPVDRYYIESFMERCSDDVRGRVLEVDNPGYTRRYGGGAVEKSDVVHPVAGSEHATIVADLAVGDGIPEGVFDCVICTQTLHLIEDVPAALSTIARSMKPGGVLLLTVPGISQICRQAMVDYGDFWRFTTRSIERLVSAAFPGGEVEVATVGNVLSSIALLQGLAAEELSETELEVTDEEYQLLLTVRVRKGAETA